MAQFAVFEQMQVSKSICFSSESWCPAEKLLAKKESEVGENCMKIGDEGIWLAEEILLILCSVAL